MVNEPAVFELLKFYCISSELILKAPITTNANDNFDFFFQMKRSLVISCESSAKQTTHMKYQDLFSLKNKKKINNFFRMSSAVNFAWRFKG